MNNHLKLATILAHILDNRFRVLGIRFGIDPLLGLIPGFGDVVTLFLSLYIVWIGINMKLPSDKINRMVINVLFDFLLGIIPVAGDIFDFVYRANLRNLKIIEEHRKYVVDGEIDAHKNYSISNY